jgi:hypothetical protein
MRTKETRTQKHITRKRYMKTRNSLLVAAAILVGLGILNLGAQTPQFLWAKCIASTSNPDDELCIGLALDSQANCYVTGWFDGTNNFGGTTLVSAGGQDIFVAKYNNSGALQWARRAGGSSPDWDVGRGIGVDNGGNVYVTGGFYGNADFGTFSLTANQDEDFFLAKYNSSGVVQWVRQSAGGGYSAYGTDLAVDGAGNCYVVGYFDGAAVQFGTTTLESNNDESSIFVVKYDSSGGLQWAQGISGSGSQGDYCTTIGLDDSGNCYVAGSFSGTLTIGTDVLVSAGDRDSFLVKFNNAGIPQWARRAGGAARDGCRLGGVDGAGNSYMVGVFGGVASFGSLNVTSVWPFAFYVARYNTVGALQWLRTAQTSNTWCFAEGGGAVDKAGNCVVAGLYSSLLDFGGIALTNRGGWDVFVAKYDTAGNLGYVQSAGGTSNDGAFRTAVDDAGNAYAAGWFQGATAFGTNTITGSGAWNFFLAKLASDGLQGQYYTYTTNNGTITITGYTGIGGAVTIPSTINGLPVTSVGEFAIASKSSLTSVTIPNSVTSIGRAAFLSCYSLTNFTIGNNVTNIASGAFQLCTSLTGVAIPSNVTRIGDGAFSGCTSLTAIMVDPENTNYTSLDGVLFNKSLTALIQCPGKTASYAVPNSVTSIESSAFWYCTSLTNVTIPNGVTNVGDYALCYCTSLTSLTIPDGVTSIGRDSFAFCTSLTSVTIPSNVTSIGSGAFSGCTSLTAIMVDPENTNYISLDGVLFNKSLTVLIQCPAKARSYTVPSSVTTIESNAFNSCSSLTNVTIPNSVTSIGEFAFSGCTSLTNVTIPNSVTSIGEFAFSGCTSLTAIMVGPENTNYISLDGVLYNKSLTVLIQCPGKARSCTIPNSVTTIESLAFNSCSSLTNVTIPNSVTSIGENAFYDCESLTSITIPNSVTSIGEEAFFFCTAMRGIYFNGNAPSLGGTYVFYYVNATVYYLPGTTGWGTTFGGRPTALWFLPNPLILNNGTSFGVQTNRFGFIISWATNTPVVVEVCTNLANHTWAPVGTNTLIGGSSYFSDPKWTNYTRRFYRLRSP